MSSAEAPKFSDSPQKRITWRTVVGNILLENLRGTGFIQKLEETPAAAQFRGSVVKIGSGEVQNKVTKSEYSVEFDGVISEKKPVLFITPYLYVVREAPAGSDA